MPCPNRRCKKGDHCQLHHTFSLRSISSNTYYRNPVQLQFCPNLDRNGNVVAHTFPVFNRDARMHTPAFFLDIDRNYSMEQDRQMLMDHMRKVKDSLQIKQQLFFPKPSHKNKYCSVCKDHYEDYREHLESLSHKKSIHKSKFNKHIEELCQLFKNRTPSKQDRQETTIDEIIEDEEEPPIRKIRRVESTIQSQGQKILAPSYSTNISAFNRQNSYLSNPFAVNYGMIGNMSMPMYYFPGISGCFPMSFSYPSWNMGEMKYSGIVYPVRPPLFEYPAFTAPIVISDDD